MVVCSKSKASYVLHTLQAQHLPPKHMDYLQSTYVLPSSTNSITHCKLLMNHALTRHWYYYDMSLLDICIKCSFPILLYFSCKLPISCLCMTQSALESTCSTHDYCLQYLGRPATHLVEATAIFRCSWLEMTKRPRLLVKRSSP